MVNAKTKNIRNGMNASAWYFSMNSIIPLALYAQVIEAAVPPNRHAVRNHENV